MALDAQLGFFERDGRFVAIAGQQVEAELGIEDGLRHVLEGEQADGLLLQLLARRRRRTRWRARRSGSRSCGSGSLACRRRRKSASAMAAGWAMTWTAARRGRRRVRFRRGGAQAGVGALFGGGGEIDDGGVGRVAEEFEGLAAGFGGAGENDGAGVEQAFGGESADDGGFVADAGEGAGLLVVGGDQAQGEVRRRRWRRGRGFRGRAGIRCRSGRRLHGLANLVLRGGAGGGRLKRRRRMPPMRMRMPLAT